MLNIRIEQLQHLQQHAEAELIEKYIRLFRKNQGADLVLITDDDLRRFCESRINAARSYGLKTELNIFIFISILIVIGRNTAGAPKLDQVKKILDDSTMLEDHKAGLLRLRVLMDTGLDVARYV